MAFPPSLLDPAVGLCGSDHGKVAGGLLTDVPAPGNAFALCLQLMPEVPSNAGMLWGAADHQPQGPEAQGGPWEAERPQVALPQVRLLRILHVVFLLRTFYKD